MTVTVAVPSLGRAEGLADCLHSILASLDRLPTPGGEVLLIVNGPHTLAFAPLDDPRLRVFHDPVAGAARARNTALDLAVNDRVLFTDDDCTVPLTWCLEMSTALDTAPAVAAPVVVPSTGAVPSFVDYKRTFVAPPLDEHTVRCMVTANCGLRRSALPAGLRFDDDLFQRAAAEDSALSYRLTDAGLPIRWLGDLNPIVHPLRNDATEIVQRFLRYGRGNARLVNAHGRWKESVPEAWSWFLSIRDGSWTDHRRFPELTEHAPRDAFVACELALTTSWLAGYIDEMQSDLGLPAISIDLQALTTGLERFVRQAIDEVSDGTWTAPAVELPKLTLAQTDQYHSLRTALSKTVRVAVQIGGDHVAVRELNRQMTTYHDLVQREQVRTGSTPSTRGPKSTWMAALRRNAWRHCCVPPE